MTSSAPALPASPTPMRKNNKPNPMGPRRFRRAMASEYRRRNRLMARLQRDDDTAEQVPGGITTAGVTDFIDGGASTETA